MRRWVADLIGLSAGLVLGGIAVAWFLQSAPPPAATSPPTQPPPLPQIAEAAPLPTIIYPEHVPNAPGGGDPAKRGTTISGTGFFVGTDGSLLTAEHVVTACQRILVVSRLVDSTPAALLATDRREDIALLRAERRPPAVLSLGRPAAATRRLFVLGYPNGGDTLVASETWAILENANLQPAPAQLADVRNRIWIDGPSIKQGFSGGPMIDPASGRVAGLVHGLLETTALHAMRAAIPPTGLVIGPGSTPMAALLRQAGGDSEDASLWAAEGDPLETARRATVHVLCLR